jgi:hypothetical protein
MKVAVHPGREQGYVVASAFRRRICADSRMTSVPTRSLGGHADWGGAGVAAGASSSVIGGREASARTERSRKESTDAVDGDISFRNIIYLWQASK